MTFSHLTSHVERLQTDTIVDTWGGVGWIKRACGANRTQREYGWKTSFTETNLRTYQKKKQKQEQGIENSGAGEVLFNGSSSSTPSFSRISWSTTALLQPRFEIMAWPSITWAIAWMVAFVFWKHIEPNELFPKQMPFLGLFDQGGGSKTRHWTRTIEHGWTWVITWHETLLAPAFNLWNRIIQVFRFSVVVLHVFLHAFPSVPVELFQSPSPWTAYDPFSAGRAARAGSQSCFQLPQSDHPAPAIAWPNGDMDTSQWWL